jgi:hypothetical protein
MAASPSIPPAPLPSTALDAEEIAELAYHRCGLRPDGEHGPGELLRRLFGPASVELTSKVRPGRVVVEFSSTLGGAPVCVRMSDRQTPEEDTIACAKACAIHEEWARSGSWTQDRWSQEFIEKVVAAIALPEGAARAAIDEGWTFTKIARHYVLDLGWVQTRIEALPEKPSLVMPVAPRASES